jgi:hypothetical protein
MSKPIKKPTVVTSIEKKKSDLKNKEKEKGTPLVAKVAPLAKAIPVVPVTPASDPNTVVLHKPSRTDTKQVGHVPLAKVLGMLRYAARHGDYVFVYSAASALVDNQCAQCLRRELVEFMLSSGFFLWYPMQMIPVLQVAAADLPSYFANVVFEASTCDFFNFPDVCTRRACDVQYNFARDLSITVNDCALNEKISQLYTNPIRGVEVENIPELQARAITFAYSVIVGINGCESSSFELSWLDVALRNAFFLSRFGLDKLLAIFDLLCLHYTFCHPYAEMIPKVRILHAKLAEGKPNAFFWNRGIRLIVVFLIFFFFFKCTYNARILPSHAVIPTARVHFVARYEAFLTPTNSEYLFARFGNLKCNLFRGYLHSMINGVPHVPLHTIAPPPFERNFVKSVNALWRGKYTNVTMERLTHFLVCRLNRALPFKFDDDSKAIVWGPIFPVEKEAISSRIAFWMDKFAALKIERRVMECIRLYFAENFSNTYGGFAYIIIKLGAVVRNLTDAQWESTPVKLFAALCATHIVDIGLTRDHFYEVVDGVGPPKLLCAAMWMPVVVVAEKYGVHKQLESLAIDNAFYEKHKSFL